MDVSETGPVYVLVCHSSKLCPSCARPLNPVDDSDDVELTIRAVTVEPGAFNLQGHGRFASGFCATCGRQMSAIEAQIPIHCSGLKCSKCGRPDELKVQVRKLDTTSHRFEFEATLECQKCQRRNRLTAVLYRLSKLLSIEIGLTGITLKAKGEEAKR